MDLVLTNHSRTITTQKRRYESLKRIMDVVICMMALPFAIPLGIICWILIRTTSAGPALFKQERIGKGGKRFTIYKFRTMHHNLDDSGHRAFMKAYISGQLGNTPAPAATSDGAESNPTGTQPRSQTFSKFFSSGKKKNQQIFKPFNASQITTVGRILRKTSLDELPQMLNVFKGEMSIVGPRPNVTWEVEAYEDWHCERLDVLPGITGLAQVRGRSSLSFDAIVENDIEYIRNRNLLMDIKIMWWTVTSAVIGKGAG